MRFMRRTMAPRRPGGSRTGINRPRSASFAFSFSGGVVMMACLNRAAFFIVTGRGCNHGNSLCAIIRNDDVFRALR